MSADGLKLKVSVRELVAYALRSGDLHQHQFGSISALEGVRGHQRLQKARGEGYQAEVTVRESRTVGEVELLISGRIDGVFINQQPVVVEEIKTTRSPFEEIAASASQLHEAQAKMYALLYARQQDLAEIATQLTYFNIDSGKTHSTRQHWARAELERFYEEVVEAWVERARMLHDWRQRRDGSLAELAFPFAEYRSGQRQFAIKAFRAVRDRQRLFAQAPTGIGKTIGALYPALKALGQGHGTRIFFLTARTSGATMAAKALNAMREQGLVAKSVHITAKDKICFDGPCNLETCPFALGYYDRIRNAINATFQQDHWDRTRLEEQARQHQVCPFEFSLDLALDADVIICDYNYAFDPGAYLKRFFGSEGGDNVLLVDEAHNLVDRSRDMYSASLRKQQILAVRRAIVEQLPEQAKSLNSINRALAPLRQQLSDAQHGESVALEAPEKVIPALQRFCQKFEHWLGEERPDEVPGPLREFYFQVRRFLRCCEFFDEDFATLMRSERDDFELKIQCLDAAKLLARLLDTCQATLFFSATLSPSTYFTKLLGGDANSPLLQLASPFPPENLGLFVVTSISTKYTDRSRSIEALAATIEVATQAKPGNYLVFFPSYAYLRQTLEHVAAPPEGTRYLVQASDMDDAARQSFLDEFEQTREGSLVGFAVMGGAFAEGIDLVGESLIGVVVVGVGLPMVCQERNLMRQHFDRAGQNGFDFAYQFPGMNRVLQTAGRVIRNERDRGMVCLIDQRFAEHRYRALFPSWWHPQFLKSGEQLNQRLTQFWESTREEQST